MIPTLDRIHTLWSIYKLPDNKRIHCSKVASVCRFIADQYGKSGIPIQTELLLAGALLHDIDKNVLKKSGEQHPDAAVRILKHEGMDEVAHLVTTHPLHAIMDPSISPKTLEEKILFLSDKMVKYEVLTVDKRFALWQKERLPRQEREILRKSYPFVKALERQIFSEIQTDSQKVIQYVH